ncbi:g8021 [Coccomyxa elongata]
MALKVVEQQFHSIEVTGADACITRPVVATCSLDRTVRIWHVHDRTSELVKQFMEEPFSIALHPGGYSMLVGFPDKLRLFTILMDDLKLTKELPVKGCTECRFSNGGHMFAAVSGNNIFIYATYNCDLIGTLRGHNGKVKSLFWSLDDALLTTAGFDGAVYQWKLKNFKRAKENVQKGCMYNCATATADSQRLYASSSDGKIKELEEVAGTGMQIIREFNTSCAILQLVLPPGGKTLYAGTDTGCIRAYKLPLSGEQQEVRCFSGAVTRLRLSHNDSLLYATSADGSLFVFEVKERDPVRSMAKRDQGEKMAYAEEVLLPKFDLDEKKQRILELEGQVRDVTLQNEYNMRLKDVAMAERIKELSDKHAAEAVEQARRYEALQQEKSERETKLMQEMQDSAQRQQANPDLNPQNTWSC